jgi:ribosomal protein S18 acetylase RimI-like enzyme
MTAIIRQFVFSQDYERVIALWENAGPGVHVGRSDAPQEIVKKLQRDPELFLVAEIDGEIVGAVLGGFDGRRGVVYHLAVTGEQRNNGIGSQLMEELEERLRRVGCRRSYLLVTPDNAQAFEFYEKRGWDKMDLFILAKDLD